MTMLLLWHSKYAFIALVTPLGYFAKEIGDAIQGIVDWYREIQGRKPLRQAAENEEKLEGIAVREIVAFVIRNNGFPIEEAKRRFQVSGNKLVAIGKRLEDTGILVKDTSNNNKRVLAEGIKEHLEEGLIDITVAPSPAMVQISPTEVIYVPTSHPYIQAKNSIEKAPRIHGEDHEKTMILDNPELA